MAGEILDCPPCGAELTLAGWSQHTGAWCAVDLSALLSGPETRGESVLVERLDGQVARRRRFDETTYTLPYVFSGAVDRLGDPHVDGLGDPVSANVGRARNLLAFREQIVTALVIAGSMEYDDGTTFAGTCIAERLEVEVKPGGLALASLRLVIPRPWTETS